MIQVNLFDSDSYKNKVGIYAITHSQTKSIYVGQSNDIARRLSNHKRDLEQKIHINTSLQELHNLYGWENFNLLLLESLTESKTDLEVQRWLEEREIFWIAKCRNSAGSVVLNKTQGEIVKTKRAVEQFNYERELEEKKKIEKTQQYDKAIKNRHQEITKRLKEIEKILQRRWDKNRCDLSTEISDLNNQLYVLRKKHSGIRFLFNGNIDKDIENNLEQEIAKKRKKYFDNYNNLHIEELNLADEEKMLRQEKRTLHSSKQLALYESRRSNPFCITPRRTKKKNFY
jgi:group I intron endonuclease